MGENRNLIVSIHFSGSLFYNFILGGIELDKARQRKLDARRQRQESLAAFGARVLVPPPEPLEVNVDKLRKIYRRIGLPTEQVLSTANGQENHNDKQNLSVPLKDKSVTIKVKGNRS